MSGINTPEPPTRLDAQSSPIASAKAVANPQAKSPSSMAAQQVPAPSQSEIASATPVPATSTDAAGAAASTVLQKAEAQLPLGAVSLGESREGMTSANTNGVEGSEGAASDHSIPDPKEQDAPASSDRDSDPTLGIRSKIEQDTAAPDSLKGSSMLPEGNGKEVPARMDNVTDAPLIDEPEKPEKPVSKDSSLVLSLEKVAEDAVKPTPNGHVVDATHAGDRAKANHKEEQQPAAGSCLESHEDTSMLEDTSTDTAITAAPQITARISQAAAPTRSISEAASVPTNASISQYSRPSTLTSVPLAHEAGLARPGPSSLPIVNPIESYNTGARRPSPNRASIEAQERARQEEAMRLQRENEDMRLMWLSLPANDHLTYYSDTEDEASSSAEGNGLAPKGAYGGMPLLSRSNVVYSNAKRKRQDWAEDERESSDSDDESLERQERSEERRYRTGNRGNKLLKGSRWNRRGKLGLWTEPKNEKEMHDRFMSRVKSIQRAGVESLLLNAPGPKAIQGGGPVPRDMLEGSDWMLLKDINSTPLFEENLQSTSLAPALLRPILSARALLESHTLRHTFRNPHIGALSKTALDLRESEGHLSRALGRCFSAMERMSAYVVDAETGEVRVNGSHDTDYEIDLKAIGAEGTGGTAEEINPALVQLDELFVTKNGLPIPVGSSEGEDQARQPTELQAVLTTNQQRDVIRAALECLQDLGLDSLEYVERLDEVRGRLEGVKRRRTQVWEALRLWALKREGGEEEEDNEVDVEEEEILISRPAAKTVAVTAGAPNRRRR